MPSRRATRKPADRFRALVIEKDPDYRSVIAHVVDIAGGQSETVVDLKHGLRQLASQSFDLVVFGVTSGQPPELEPLAELRARAQAPVLLLIESYDEARTQYEAGADQILPKPFVPGALVGAIKAQLRGPSPTSILPMASRIEIGGVVFDSETRTVLTNGHKAVLTGREWQLLAFFLANANRYYEASEILSQTWGQELSGEQFRTYITRIRKKLGPLSLPMRIVNQPGVGYCMLLGDG
jgi:DNA-binding response OmpR family regulator